MSKGVIFTGNNPRGLYVMLPVFNEADAAPPFENRQIFSVDFIGL